MASIEGNFCRGNLNFAMNKYLKSLESAQLPEIIRSAVRFECRACGGSNVLCTASTRPGTDFGRLITAAAVRSRSRTVHLIAPWLNNDDFAWACKRWPLSFAPFANVVSIATRHIYTAKQACQIIAGGSAACVLVGLRPPPSLAVCGSAVRAWNIWRKTGVLYPPWQQLILSTLRRCSPRTLPPELLERIILFLQSH